MEDIKPKIVIKIVLVDVYLKNSISVKPFL